MSNNTPARIYLNGVEQHHVRDYSTSAGWLIKRKQKPDGSLVLNPDKTFATERLEGEVVAIGDDRFVGQEVVYTPVAAAGGQSADPVVKVHVTVERKSGAKEMVGGLTV